MSIPQPIHQSALFDDRRRWCKRCREPFPEADFRREDDGFFHHCSTCRRARKKAEWRRRDLKKKYGITPQQYDAMLESQNGGCAICGREYGVMRGQNVRLDVDHDHATGKVRGILCNQCNSMIARVDERPETLDRAAAYLRRFQ